jgi:hypothetical protein
LSTSDTVSIESLSSRLSCVDIRIEHVCQNVLGILQPLDHFKIGGFHCATKRVGLSLPSLVNISHKLGLRAEHDFSMVLEVNLDNFV